MKGIINTNNDKLGLAGKWFAVPKEGPRPESAILFDRKGGVAKDTDIRIQAAYWRSVKTRYTERNKKGKNRNQDRKA